MSSWWGEAAFTQFIRKGATVSTLNLEEKTKSGRAKNPKRFCMACERTTQHRDATYVGDSEPKSGWAGMMINARCTECDGITSGTD